jgi:hypothetical protein
MFHQPTRRAFGTIAAVLTLSAAGCGPTISPDEDEGRRISSGGTVIEGEELRAGGVRLLDGLRGRVSIMQVSHGGGCPQVVLRGPRTIAGSTRPEVYVDGTRMTDTCILDQIRSAEVERVEIYAGGARAQGAYRSGPNGLIVVFLVSEAN